MLSEVRVACFLSLAKTLNYHRTAEELFLTQQSVSQHITAMEESLGFQLFVRTNRFVALTQVGMKCYEFFSKYEQQYKNLLEECAQLSAAAFRTLKVGYQGWISLGSAANSAVDSMLKQHPGLELEIERHSPALLYHKLSSGELPVTLQCGRWLRGGKNIRVGKLRSVALVLLVDPDHPVVRQATSYLDLARLPLIVDAVEHESEVETIRRGQRELKRLGMPPTQIIVASDREAAHTMAEMKKGMLVTTEIDHAAQSGHFKAFETESKDSLVCAWRTDTDNELALLFAHCLQAEYRAVRNNKAAASKI